MRAFLEFVLVRFVVQFVPELIEVGAQDFCERFLDGVGPDFVAFFGKVEVVGHDVAGDAAVFGEEFMAKIDPENVFAVGEFLDDLVGEEKFSALWCWVLAAREDGNEKDFGGGPRRRADQPHISI